MPDHKLEDALRDWQTIHDPIHHHDAECAEADFRAGYTGARADVEALKEALADASARVLGMLHDGYEDSMDDSIRRAAEGWQTLASS